MLTREALTAAGWRLTSAHAASSYSVEVVVTPDGTALGDGDMVRIREDGTIDPDPLTGSGKLTCGAEVRELLTETEEPSYFIGYIGMGEFDAHEAGYTIFATGGEWIAEDAHGVRASSQGDAFTFAAQQAARDLACSPECAEALDREAWRVARGHGVGLTLGGAWGRMGTAAREHAREWGWPMPECPEVRGLIITVEGTVPGTLCGDTLTPDTETPCATMRETDQGVNGYPTWAAHNWLTGNEEPYRYWHARACECVRRFRHAPGTASARQEAALRCLTDALAAEHTGEPLTDTASLESDLLTWALRRVEWRTVAEAFMELVPEELTEEDPYRDEDTESDGDA